MPLNKVTGTGGGTSIRRDSILSWPFVRSLLTLPCPNNSDHIFIAPSGVQKELLQPRDMFVLDYRTREYLRRPPSLRPSACTPLFLTAFDQGAGCCIHTHSQWAVLVTLLVEREFGLDACFQISMIEQIKGLPRGKGKDGNLGYHDTLRVPIIENTAQYG
ncbi:MAG: Methylthioribulose-1-phosphate dehydratase [Peltula sp. TS41687]|nr:MAG: Methylthioribulose-1-phosphate dehydratase [Peltula sp. TS41687]